MRTKTTVSESTRLRDWRLKQGLSLRDLANLSGLSAAMLSRAERGERGFSPAAKIRLARSLQVSVTTLFDPPRKDTHAA
jgi:transcriptional regulator with XRE-family HTH domain